MKFILSSIFAVSLLLVGACNNNNGSSLANNNVLDKNTVVIKSPGNYTLERTVDCDAGVVIYHKQTSLAVLPFNYIPDDFINMYCH